MNPARGDTEKCGVSRLSNGVAIVILFRLISGDTVDSVYITYSSPPSNGRLRKVERRSTRARTSTSYSRRIESPSFWEEDWTTHVLVDIFMCLRYNYGVIENSLNRRR